MLSLQMWYHCRKRSTEGTLAVERTFKLKIGTISFMFLFLC